MRSPAALVLAGCALLGMITPAAARVWGQLQFSPCTLSAARGVQTASGLCATLEVAENRQADGGGRLALSLVWIPAEDPQAPADPLLLLAGGPGQSAQQAYFHLQPALDRLRRSRHLLLLDQRGTGRSHPLHCDLDAAYTDVDLPPERLRELVRDCAQRLSAQAALAHYTTVDAVADLEALRQALATDGQAPTFNLIGGSYGTRVGLDYLRRYPQGVRSLILDGVVPPTLALGNDHAINLQQAVDRVFAACRDDAACHRRFGDPQATLQTLRQQLQQEPLRVSLPHPVTHQPLQETLSDTLLAVVLRFYAYAPEFVRLTPFLIDEALQGRPQALLAQWLMLRDSLENEMAYGMQLSVICSEDADLLQPREENEGSLLGNDFVELTRLQCEEWPHKPRPADFHDPVISEVPTLLLSGEWDPVTPPAYGEAVAQTLSRSRHLVARGQGHIVLSRGCTARLAARFLDTLDPAALDASCLDVLAAPSFATGYQGSEP